MTDDVALPRTVRRFGAASRFELTVLAITGRRRVLIATYTEWTSVTFTVRRRRFIVTVNRSKNPTWPRMR
jgi:hypothetical protein